MEAASIADLDEARARVAEEAEREEAEADAAEGFDDGGSASAEERANEGSVFDDDQGEMFPVGSVDGDPKKTIRNLLSARVRVDYEAKVSAIAVPIVDGLLDLDVEGEVLVSYAPGKVEIVPKRNPDSGRVETAIVRQHLKPTHATSARKLYTRSQVEDMLTQVGIPGDSPKAKELLGV